MFAVLPVRQYFWRINGKHKINILCALCGSACPMKSLLNLFNRGGEYKYQVRPSLGGRLTTQSKNFIWKTIPG